MSILIAPRGTQVAFYNSSIPTYDVFFLSVKKIFVQGVEIDITSGGIKFGWHKVYKIIV